MAKVTCAYCKTKINKEEAYCKHAGKHNTYYCNEEHFAAAAKKREMAQILKAEKSEYDAIFEQTKKIFGYEFLGYGILKKEVKLWEKLANRNKILNYLQENENFLSSIMKTKEFANDFNRVRYYSVVVSSKLHDYKPEKKIEPVISEPIDDHDYIMPINKKRKTERRKGFGE